MLEELFDILSGIMEGLNAIKKSSGMDTTEMRFRIIKLLRGLVSRDSENRVELLAVD